MTNAGRAVASPEKSYHQLRILEVFEALGTSAQGLTNEEAAKRLQQHGRNVIRSAPKKRLYLKLLVNFTHLMALLLWIAGAMAFMSGSSQLGWAIWSVIIINAVFSFWQEFQAERAMAALRKLLPVQATVVRGGEERLVPAEELVPGDLLVIAEGDRISADGRLVEEAELRIDQSTLSGESHAVRKTADPVQQESLSHAELPNLVFAGTTAAAGTGKAVVFATGMQTEFGRIAHLTSALQEAPSPLQQQINRMTRVVTMLAVGIGTLFFLLSVTLLHRPAHTGFIFAIGMVVAFVPEGLLPTVSLSLAIAVQRMARRKALVKRLSSVEALGCCTVICTDKTGTLTQNEMTVRDLWLPGHKLSVTGGGYAPAGEIVEGGQGVAPAADPGLRRLLLAAALCNDARLIPPAEAKPWSVLGDPTEAALKVVAMKGGLDVDAEAASLPRLRELPFDSVRKRMTTVHREGDGETAFVKGSPGEVAALCSGIVVSGEVMPLDPDRREQVLAANDAYAREGLRVLAIAERRLPPGFTGFCAETVERELVLLGLAAMLDPARPEVASAVEKCHRAGIRLIMVTGDYGLTAESIARRIGIVSGERGVRILTGADLDAMNDAALQAALAEQVIFARVAPHHKLRVVTVLQQLRHVVAVTGDGVNDAPALKKADIGVAMGVAGSDVAKEAAEMVLLDDNFASIVNAVEEGRAVYANIRKFVTYIFTSNVTEAWPFILQIMFNIPLALTVMQILAIDLGTDMVPALALGTERPEPGIMDKPPRSPNERLINASLLMRALLWLGTMQALLSFAAFFYLYNSYGYTDLLHLPRVDLLPYAQRLLTSQGRVYVLASTVFFAAVVCTQIGNAYACRTERLSVFSVGFFGNRFLLAGIAFQLILCGLLIYQPLLQPTFEVGPLPFRFWALVLSFSLLLFLPEEGRKAWLRRRERRRREIAAGAAGGGS